MAECTGAWFLLNGEQLRVEDFDDSFLSSTGYIYEVFRVIDGIPLFLEDHLERLSQSFSLTGISLPYALESINKQVLELIRINALGNGNIKIVLTGGDIPPGDTPSASSKQRLLMYITPHQYPDNRQFREGVGVSLHRGSRENPNAKVMDTPLRQQANRIKELENVYETLLVDTDGYISEGSRSNVFFVIGDLLVTPPTQDVLPGITRKKVMECCLKEGIPCREDRVGVADLERVEAAFITGTSRKVLPINRIGDYAYPADHPLIRRVQHAFNNHVTVYLLNIALQGL